MTLQIQALAAGRFELAEGVLWDERLAVLWWTDIYAATLWQFQPASGQTREWALPGPLASMALTAEPGVLLLGLSHALVRFDTASGALRMLTPVRHAASDIRVNDGRCDRAGNFLFGSMVEQGKRAEGRFYRYTAQGRLERLDLPPVAISNSLCLSPDGETLYYSDTVSGSIMACRYDGMTGKLGQPRQFVRVERGAPDGSTVDADGYLWNAAWGGHCVTRYRPDGRIDAQIDLPAAQPSCVAFGGADLTTLYVTSAAQGLAADAADEGRIYRIEGLAARGLPESRFGGGEPLAAGNATRGPNNTNKVNERIHEHELADPFTPDRHPARH